MRRHQHDHPGPVDGSAVDQRRARPIRPAVPVRAARPQRPVDLFGTAYAPEDGTPGGTVIIGDWQEATQFNPYYLGQVTEANVASLAWHSLLTITHDFKYTPQLAAEPIPTTDNGGVTAPGENGDAMTVTWKLRDGLKWSDGEPLTCDDFKYAYEWVLDPDNVGVITAGWEDITNFECASDTDMIWHFGKVYEGYLTLATAPLPRHYLDEDPGQGPGQRRRASGPTRSPSCRSAVPSSSSRSRRRPSSVSRATTTTRTRAPASRPTSTPSCSSGTAIRTR